MDDQSRAVGYRLESSGFSRLWAAEQTPSSLQMVQDASGLYCAYALNNQALVIRNAVSGEIITNTLSAGYLTNPAVCKQGNFFYALYSDFFANGEASQAAIWQFDGASRAWSKMRQTGIERSNIHAIAAQNGKL